MVDKPVKARTHGHGGKGGKGHGGGKGKGKGEVFYRDAETGAIKKNNYVLALDRDGTWKAARIMEVRKRVYIDSDDEPVEHDEKPKEDKNEPKENGDSHHRAKEFEYYVNYLELERRNDRWLLETQVRIDPDIVDRKVEEIEREKKRVEEEKARTGFLANDEHHGLQEHQIREFIEATRLKTVEFLCIGETMIETWYFSPLP